MHHPLSPAQTDVQPSLVRAELDRVLGSEVFSRSERLSAFLRFIVEQTLAGHGDSLKEHVIAVELYGKSVDFNTAADPIVRVDARRLRDKLREYYASVSGEEIVISVPKGSYTPVFEVHGAVAGRAATAAAIPGATPERRDSRWVSIGAALLVVGALAWLVTGRLTRRESVPAWRQLTVTSFPGSEEDPALSPDGNFIAFSWKKEPEPSVGADIWVKAVEGDALRQLTFTHDAMEKYPAWSPDGRYIAFTRIAKGLPGVYLVSSLGGPERQIAERGGDVAWLPDGQSLVMVGRTPQQRSGLVHHILATGERRQLTEAPAGFVEVRPKVSPDGRRVAFSRGGEGRTALFVTSIAGGAPTRLGEWSGVIGGLTWTPDGREILFARPELSGRRLVRVAANGGKPVAVPAAPYGAVNPSVSLLRPGGTYRLALSTGTVDVGLRMIDLQARRNGATTLADEPFCDATRMDVPGRFSRDGTQVAFVSDRGGSQQIWVARRDGSALRSLTNLSGATMNVGSWSPDGEWLVFDATIAGNTDLYLARVADGSVQRKTDTPAADYDAEWSRDGRWVYYVSNESGQSTIWKIPAGGGPRVQLTTEVGYEPRESPDGQRLYFVDRPRTYGLGFVATLKQIPIQGGPSTTVEARVMAGAWDVTDSGIVFVVGRANPMDASPAPDVLAVYDFAEGGVTRLGELGFRVAPFGSPRYLAVSPDRRWTLASHVDNWDRDIIVVDNFK
jgi:Tol biopolymer transport system component